MGESGRVVGPKALVGQRCVGVGTSGHERGVQEVVTGVGCA